MIEILLTILLWLIQIVGFIALPLILCAILIRFKNRRFAASMAVILLAVEIVAAVKISAHPPIFDASGSRLELTAEREAIIRRISDGIHDICVPLLPYAVIITANSEDLLTWTTRYLFWGTTGHTYDLTEGIYERTKPLSNWNPLN